LAILRKILWNGNILLQILSFLNKKYSPKTEIFTLKSQNFATVAYHMKKECLRFSIFIFLISPNLAECVFFLVYHDLSNITKSKIKNKKSPLQAPMIFLGIFLCSQSGDLEKEAIVL
jgi:hypothetical protein